MMSKKLLLFLFLTVNTATLFASTVTFWTNSKTTGGSYIEIYVNNVYRGKITSYYGSAPDCGARGCVTVNVTGTNNTWRAVGQDGSEWTGRLSLSSGCNTVRLH